MSATWTSAMTLTVRMPSSSLSGSLDAQPAHAVRGEGELHGAVAHHGTSPAGAQQVVQPGAVGQRHRRTDGAARAGDVLDTEHRAAGPPPRGAAHRKPAGRTVGHGAR